MVVAMQNTKNSWASYTFHSLDVPERGVTISVRETCKMNSTVIAWSGAKSTLLALESVMFEIKSTKNEQFDKNDDKMAARELLRTPEDDGYSVFVLLLRSYFVEFGYGFSLVRHQKVRLPKSTYISCCGTPTLTDKM